jgi:hypothetical protein
MKKRMGIATTGLRIASLLGAGLILLSGCSAYDTLMGKEKPTPSCPRVSVLADAATLTRFRDGPGRDLIDIVFEGKIAGIDGGCEWDLDDDTGEGVLVIQFSVILEAARGPADRTRRAGLDYFVALTDAKRKLIDKQIFKIPVEFPGNETRLRLKDDIVTLKLPVKIGQAGGDFEVFVGFQVNRGELEDNRRRNTTGKPVIQRG